MKYAFKAQIKEAKRADGILILPSARPDCESVLSKCTVTSLCAAFAHIDK